MFLKKDILWKRYTDLLRWCCVVCVLLLGACSWSPSSRCLLGGDEVRYEVSSSCSGVLEDSNSSLHLVWKDTPSNEAGLGRMLQRQAYAQGFRMEDLVFRWSPESCTEEGEQRRRPVGILRVVLAPEVATSSLRVLLVCQPIGQKEEKEVSLQRDWLMACRRGASKSIDCSLELRIRQD